MSSHNEAPSKNVSASTAGNDLPADAGRRHALPFPVVGVGASAGGLCIFARGRERALARASLDASRTENH